MYIRSHLVNCSKTTSSQLVSPAKNASRKACGVPAELGAAALDIKVPCIRVRLRRKRSVGLGDIEGSIPGDVQQAALLAGERDEVFGGQGEADERAHRYV